MMLNVSETVPSLFTGSAAGDASPSPVAAAAAGGTFCSSPSAPPTRSVLPEVGLERAEEGEDGCEETGVRTGDWPTAGETPCDLDGEDDAEPVASEGEEGSGGETTFLGVSGTSPGSVRGGVVLPSEGGESGARPASAGAGWFGTTAIGGVTPTCSESAAPAGVGVCDCDGSGMKPMPGGGASSPLTVLVRFLMMGSRGSSAMRVGPFGPRLMRFMVMPRVRFGGSAASKPMRRFGQGSVKNGCSMSCLAVGRSAGSKAKHN
mmetsp:Transcript_24575/g.61646  ORF Transcript_24575/g.61646 Transcript_24575/m.61646 type:complete len:262 (+) Transcript_24575:220-1005(+)